MDFIAARVRQAGEPFQLFFSPDQMQGELKSQGFTQNEELARDDINQRYFGQRSDGLQILGGAARLITAWK